MAITSILK
jgi:hypothetical protein